MEEINTVLEYINVSLT